MKTFWVSLVVLSLTGCAKAPKLDVSLTLDKQSADLIFVRVKVVNTEDRATVPIAIEVTGQAETNGHWDKSSTLMHPAAFVLNQVPSPRSGKELPVTTAAIESLQAYGIPVAPVGLRSRAVYANSTAEGRCAQEVRPESVAAQEVEALFQYVWAKMTESVG